MQRIKSLEGLRGLAAILVLFNHLAVMFYPAHYWGGVYSHCYLLEYFIGQTPLFFLVSGSSGVYIFLILTGFGSYIVCNKGSESTVKYASLRFFKLSILMFVSTITIWLLYNFRLVYFSDAIQYTSTVWIQGYNPFVNNILDLIIGNWFDISTRYNPALWTMRNIFIGSVICIFIYTLWGNLKKGYFVPLIFGILFIIMGLPHYVACVLGYILARYYILNSCKFMKASVGVGIFLIAILLCGFPVEIKPQFLLYSFFPQRYVEYYHMIGAFLLVYICLFCSPVKRIAESKPLLVLGKFSMSAYIVHFVVLISITSFLFTKLIKWFSYNISALIVWIITVIVVYVVAIPLKNIIDILYKDLDRIYNKVHDYMKE